MSKQIMSFKDDWKFGMQGEKKFFKYLTDKLKISDIERGSQYCFYDFISESKKLVIELKTRRRNYRSIRRTNIPYSKLRNFRKFNARKNYKYLFIMVFQFYDGIYFFEHKEGYNYTVEKFCRKKRIDYDDKPEDYIWIQKKDLEPICNIRRYTDSKMIVRYNV